MRNLVVAKLFNCVADCVPKVQNLAEAAFFFVLGNYVSLNFNAPGYNFFERFRIVFCYAVFENLKKLIYNKEELIKKALGIDEATVTEKDGNICFAWIAEGTNPDEVTAITQFVTALCDMAKKQKRINTTEADVENEKYAFRCFLLRLGFIGSEYKATRKVLLKRLEGSSAFRTQKEGVAE